MHQTRQERRKWSRLLAEIAALKRRGRKHRIQLPDLYTPSNAASLSNVIAVSGHWTAARQRPEGAKQFAVDHSHKQGLELLTPGIVKNGLAYLGGNKT